MASKGQAALAYATRFGWHVFPVWWIKEDGKCACGQDSEHSAGKHPIIKGWEKQATTDGDLIRRWWRARPDANVGVATGAGSGIVVIDVDPRHAGGDTLAALEAEHGKLPATPTVLTGGGGYHYFFRHPGGKVSNDSLGKKLGPGIDVRGDGGFVVVPRSNHISGNLYEWEIISRIGDLELAEAPDWWKKALVEPTTQKTSFPAEGASIPEGKRHGALLQAAGRMRKAGFSASEIEAALLRFNAERCKPPVPEDEVRRIAHDIGVKPLGDAIIAVTAQGRPQIRVNDRDYDDLLKETWDALIATNDPPTLFRMDDVLVRLRQNGSLIARPVNQDVAFDILANRVAFYKAMSSRSGGLTKIPTLPLRDLTRSMVANVHSKLPELHFVAHAPVFSPTGRLLDSAGYHEEAGAWVSLDGLRVGAVPTQPSPVDMREALSTIDDELLHDFPFVGGREGAHYANMLGLLLLPFVRSMINGPTPLFFIESATPGSGKSLLAKTVMLVATGHDLGTCVVPNEEEEVRKTITAELIAASPIVMFDNFSPSRQLRSSTLAALTTSPVWRDRLLGQSKGVHLANRAIWIVTGNNPKPGDDFVRRACQIRLDPNVERPWDRSQFRHPNLPGWIRSYRSQLVRACLTIVQNWIYVGAPRGLLQVGSFEEWGQVISGILEVAGVGAFMGNASEFYEGADIENEGIRSLVEAWYLAYKDALKSATDVIDLCRDNEELNGRLNKGGTNDRARVTNLGLLLREVQGRVFGDLKLERIRDSHLKRNFYRVSKLH